MADIQDIFGEPFDSKKVEPNEGFNGELLPAGLYTLEITSAEVKDNKKGTGKLLKLEHTVIDPEQFARRKVWKQMNLRNENAQAETIGRAELSGLCRAAGIDILKDTDEFMGKVIKARVTIRKGDGQYGDQNEIKGYESALATAKAADAPKPAGNGKTTPPWQKKAA